MGRGRSLPLPLEKVSGDVLLEASVEFVDSRPGGQPARRAPEGLSRDSPVARLERRPCGRGAATAMA